MTDVSYTGSEAAKVWHFCAAQLESIVTNFDAVVKADPESEIPNTVTITAEKKFENKIRKRLREVKRIVLSLQEGRLFGWVRVGRTELFKWIKKLNQRTSGTVNAHLIWAVLLA